MKCREAIFDYLKIHKTFCAREVSRLYGLSPSGISQTARRMEDEKILTTHSRRWRDVRYRLRTAADENRSAGNTIFDECRRNWQGYQVHKIFGSARA